MRDWNTCGVTLLSSFLSVLIVSISRQLPPSLRLLSQNISLNLTTVWKRAMAEHHIIEHYSLDPCTLPLMEEPVLQTRSSNGLKERHGKLRGLSSVVLSSNLLTLILTSVFWICISLKQEGSNAVYQAVSSYCT